MTSPESTQYWRSWSSKFRDAGRGIVLAVRGERSFVVHLTMAGLVILCAAYLQLAAWEWSILILCIGLVTMAETFNSAVERLAKAVNRPANADVGAALDMASGAVLLAAVTAAIVGLLIFLRHLPTLFS